MDTVTPPESMYLVQVSQYSGKQQMLYRTRDAAETAQAWFEEYGYGPIPIHEVSVNAAFDPPTEN